MTIEIQKPELEALIELRMAKGHFQSIEEFLLSALKSTTDAEDDAKPEICETKPNLADFLMNSPLRGSGIHLERAKDYPRTVQF